MTKKESMEYIYKLKKGYVEDIISEIGEENFKSLTLLGFIKRGKEISNKDSWQTTNLLEKFISPYKKELSLFDKMRFFINKKIG